MYHERIQIETQAPIERGLVAAITRFIGREIAYHKLVQDLSALTPELLADIELKRGDIRRFARAVTRGKDPCLTDADDGPMTTIGTRDWSRAYLLRLGSN